MIPAPSAARERLFSEIRGLEELPPLPHNTQRLLAALGDDEIPIPALAALIEEVPQLAARVVGLARSAFFGCRSQVRSVSDAIIRVLGMSLVKSLSVGIALSGPFRVDRCPAFSPKLYWSSALLTASLSRALAMGSSAREAPDADAAYLCGLLHNLGLLAMVHLAPDAFEHVLETAEASPDRPLTEIETELLGTNHCEVGAFLAARWFLPDEVAIAVERHHDAQYRGHEWAYPLVVGLAAGWSRQRLAGIESPWIGYESLHALRIPAEAFAGAVEHAETRFVDIEELSQLLAASG